MKVSNINNSFNNNKDSFNENSERPNVNKYFWKILIPILVGVISSLIFWFITK